MIKSIQGMSTTVPNNVGSHRSQYTMSCMIYAIQLAYIVYIALNVLRAQDFDQSRSLGSETAAAL